MCCQPDHIGPPPGWYEGTAEVETMAEIRAAIAGVSMAERLNTLAACLHQGHQRGSGPGRGPLSTEGGRGRALPREVTPQGWQSRAEDLRHVLDLAGEPEYPPNYQ